MRKRERTGSLLLTLTALIWGTAFVFQRVGMESIGPAAFTCARMALSALAVGAAALIAGRRRGRPEAAKESWRAALPGGICCGCFLAAASLAQQAGMVYTPAGKAGFITALYILIVPLLELLLFRKRSGARVWLAVAVGAAGLYLLCVNGSFRLTRGDTLVCLCAFLFSGHILCCGHFSRRAEPLCLSAIQFLTVTLLSGLVALFTETLTPEALRAALLPILYCGLISSGVGYTLQMTAQRMTAPTVASLILSLEAVFAALAGALLLHERMSGRELLGCALMFAAILLVQLPGRAAAGKGTAR